MTPLLRSLPLSAVCVLTACSHYATVSETKPVFRPAREMIGAMAEARATIATAWKAERRHPLDALGGYLEAARAASERLRAAPADREARSAYNFAVARAIGTIKGAKLDPWTRPLPVPSAGGGFTLTHRPDPRPAWHPSLYDFTPTDQIAIGGTYVEEHVTKEGIGAPVVASSRGTIRDAGRRFATERVFYGVTAVVRFEGRRAEVAFEDPLATEAVRLAGRSFPQAADFTAPLAVMLDKAEPKKLELSRLLRPGKYAETARISRLQPYDPNKTVVLVIHGLGDTPATWTKMLNHLRGQEEIRRNFQFWFYSYPSGYPYPHSAAILRHDLDAIGKAFPLRKKMVVIGHSMGGCISRLLITDTGDELWRKVFPKPPGEMMLTKGSRQVLTEALVFSHRDEVGRVIFVSAPLRGSDLASNWVGRIGSKLVKSPQTLLETGREVFRFTSFLPGELQLKRIPNSIDTLAPNNRFVRAINTLPVTAGIPHHVICGDRGKGGNKDQTKPVMSDGVVPYWSSHMETAASERIVPSGHSAHQNPEAIAEVARILRLHAGQ